MSSRPDKRRQADDDMEVDAKRRRDVKSEPEAELKEDKTSFMDLPDEMLIQIFKYLDFPNRRKLRINKRLDQLELCVKNKLEQIELEICRNVYELTIIQSNHRFSFLWDDFDGLVHGLNRMALNVHVQSIYININWRGFHNNILRVLIIDAFSNFDADKLIVGPNFISKVQVNLSTLLNLAQNIKFVWGIQCDLITAKDLCTFRKAVVDGNCKLERFRLGMKRDKMKEFVKECFGVTVKYFNHSCGKICDTSDQSIELYHRPWYSAWPWNVVHHYEGDVETQFGSLGVYLKKFKGGAKPGDDYEKIVMNQLYRC